MRLLLEERVSIRNLPLILEAISEVRNIGAKEVIAEHVRQRLGFQIVAEIRREDGTLPLIQLAPEWDKTFSGYQVDDQRGFFDVALPPEVFENLQKASWPGQPRRRKRNFPGPCDIDAAPPFSSDRFTRQRP